MTIPVYTDTTSTGSVANKYLTTTVNIGSITSVALLGLTAESVIITVRDGLGGTILYTSTTAVSGGNVTNAWDYYFTDPAISSPQTYISGMPSSSSAHITIELSGGSEVSVGNIILGTPKELGLPEYGLTSEIMDFSKKTTDDFGRTTFVKRGFKRTMDCNMFIEKSDLARVETLLEDVRSTPILVIASEDTDYSETAIRYCFYKSFRTEIHYPTFSFCSIQFEGLI
jgi:hypothetical protein